LSNASGPLLANEAAFDNQVYPIDGRRLKRPVDALVGCFATIYLVLY